MKKKINLKEWTYIGRYNYAAKWCRKLCSYYIVKKDNKTIKRMQKINLFWYIVIFIPIHLLQALVCLWDGGLKEFTILSRNLGEDALSKGSESFNRAEAVLNNQTISELDY